jgi:CPA1 family monovalent cation:H+ antiporter
MRRTVGALSVPRLLWVYPAAHLPPLLSPDRSAKGFAIRAAFSRGWAGLRGSVTMAAALSIPLVTATGAPFPERDLIIFLAGTTIVLTLVINGLTLPWLIRFLGVHGDGNAQREERAARIALAQAASNALRESLPKLKRAEEIAVAHRLIDDYERQLHRHSANANRRADLDTLAEAERKLRLAALRAERAELQEMREADVINDETARSIEMEIDHAESFVAPAALRSHG